MKRCISSSRRITAAFFAGTVLAISGSVFAQTVDDVLAADQRRLNLAQQSQQRVNNIVEGTRSLEDQYRAVNKEIDGLKVYNRLTFNLRPHQAVVDLESVDFLVNSPVLVFEGTGSFNDIVDSFL